MVNLERGKRGGVKQLTIGRYSTRAINITNGLTTIPGINIKASKHSYDAKKLVNSTKIWYLYLHPRQNY